MEIKNRLAHAAIRWTPLALQLRVQYDQRADDGGFSYGDVEEPTLRFGDQSRPWELADSEGIPSWAGPLQSGLRTYGVDAPSGPVRTNVKDDDDDDGFGHAFDVNSDPLTGGGPGKLPRGTSIDDYNAWKAAGGVPIGGDGDRADAVRDVPEAARVLEARVLPSGVGHVQDGDVSYGKGRLPPKTRPRGGRVPVGEHVDKPLDPFHQRWTETVLPRSWVRAPRPNVLRRFDVGQRSLQQLRTRRLG